MPNKLELDKNNTISHIIIKDKSKLLKAAREGKKLKYKGNMIIVTTNLSYDILQAREEQNDILKVLRKKLPV